MVYSNIRAPLSYYDVTPSGQIINKFSNDLSVLDYTFASQLNGLVNNIIIVIISFINIISLTPLTVFSVLIGVIIMIAFFLYSKSAFVDIQ